MNELNRRIVITPADARAAFQRGAVHPWAIWDPFFAAAQKQIGARVLTNAEGITSGREGDEG